jgi:predicted nucleic acid-binding protein
MKERRNPDLRVTVDAFRSKLNGLPIEIDESPDEEAVVAIARLRGLTFYDAAYLELAVRLAIPLATVDRSMTAAALAQGVTLIDLDTG